MRAVGVMLAAALVGCGGGGEDSALKKTAEPTAQTAQTVATPAPAATPTPTPVAAQPQAVTAAPGAIPTIDALPDPATFGPTPKGLMNGAFAPELARTDLLGGGEYRLSASVGPQADPESETKVAIVGMVASWCGPCGLSLPFLKELEEQHGGAVEVILVATDVDAEGRKKEAAKVAAAGLDAPVLDPTEDDLRAWMGSKRNVPHFYIINQVGEVLVQDRGFGNKVRKVMPKQVNYALNHPEYVVRRKPR
ncbi:MAG: hypothetical protein KDA24_20510 [Deltaproteobacteria bacterium]|nr:hypothetical protein [Deltaproteobacteria bacterium]